MKKVTLGIVISLVVLVVLASASLVFAQGPNPPTTPQPGFGYGQGMMGGRGGMMGGRGLAGDQDGFLHDEMIAAFAQKLGITVDDLNARLAKGETMAQVASSKGLTVDQFRTLMTDARNQALDAAVKNGKLTQEQADWMKQRGAGMMGGRGAGMGRGANGSCPYYSTQSTSPQS
jgi:hypothetical protein